MVYLLSICSYKTYVVTHTQLTHAYITGDCVELRAISNGMISYSPDMTADYSAGTVATHTCDDGFEVVPGVGNSMRTCLPVEQMSGDDPRSEFDGEEPRCERKCSGEIMRHTNQTR